MKNVLNFCPKTFIDKVKKCPVQLYLCTTQKRETKMKDLFEIADYLRTHRMDVADVAKELGMTDRAVTERIHQATQDFKRTHLTEKITAAGVIWIAMSQARTHEKIAAKLAQRAKLDDGERDRRKQRAFAQRDQGASIREIAETLSVSETAVGRWLKGATRSAIKTTEQRKELDRALELRSQGYSVRQIADLVGAPSSTIHRWVRQENQHGV